MRIFLGAMIPEDACNLVHHHYPQATEDHLAAFKRTLPADMVPAELEALCAQHDALPDLTAHLRASQCDTTSVSGADTANVAAANPAAGMTMKQCDGGDLNFGRKGNHGNHMVNGSEQDDACKENNSNKENK